MAWPSGVSRSETQPVSIIACPTRVRAGIDAREILSTEPLILPSTATSIRNNFDAWLYREGITPRIVAEVDDMAMIRLLTRADHGVAVVPPIVVRGELESRRLVEVEHFEDLKESFYAITLRRRFENPLVRQLLEEHYQPSASSPG